MNVKRFGIDSPMGPILFFLGGIGLLVHGYLNRMSYNIASEMVAGVLLIIASGFFLHTTMRGKYLIFDQLMAQLEIAPSDQVLDIGCGRGALLTRIAQQLVQPGKVTGIDLWHSREQSNNSLAMAQKNLDELNLADRAQLVTGDMAELPFAANHFDIVATSFAFHYIQRNNRRGQVVAEAIRVLKPGGKIAIIDTGHFATQYRDVFRANHVQITETKSLGVKGWWSGPLMGSYLVCGVKQ